MPRNVLDNIWTFSNPLLFATAGALILTTKLTKMMVGKAVAIIFIAMAGKIIACVVTSYNRKWTLKERVFISVCQIPKAAVQASLSGMFLSDARKYNIPEFIIYGEEIQTTGVLSIVFCGTIGSFLVETLYPRLLRPDK